MAGSLEVVRADYLEAHERQYRNRTIIVENVSPVYRREEREEIKRSIEEQLYDVFCKYMSS